MGKVAFLGTFDAERYWRDPRWTRLPEINDPAMSRTVAAMDELLFPLCQSGDVLITRYAMNPALKDYLAQTGFGFYNNCQDLEPVSGLPDPASVFELLDRQYEEPGIHFLFEDVIDVSPYAVFPSTHTFRQRRGFSGPVPSAAVVQKVNSKIYSHQLHDRVGLKKVGTVVYSSAELETAAVSWSSGRGVLIKDPFGVSGKGNVLITSMKMLQRIARYLVRQEAEGYQTCFLVEPYLEKKQDFSCQMRVEPDGGAKVISVQTIFNTQFAYAGSMTAAAEWVQGLAETGYFETMKAIAAQLAQDGYFGELCVDSMRLANGEIVPLVEVNARKSMGLINCHLDRFLQRFAVQGYFCFLALGFKGAIRFETLLEQLEAAGILFTPERGWGVMPLSANTLFANRDAEITTDNTKIFKGRLYMSLVASSQERRKELAKRVRTLLEALSFTVYSPKVSEMMAEA